MFLLTLKTEVIAEHDDIHCNSSTWDAEGRKWWGKDQYETIYLALVSVTTTIKWVNTEVV